MQTRREEIVRILRERILTGALRAGDRIDLSGLADELDTSRTPVREACLELMHEGLVQVAPRSGVIVIGVTAEDILESFSLMAALAGVAAQWAAERIDAEQLARVQELKVEVAVAVRAGDDAAVANWMLHREINKACESQRLLTMLANAARMIPRSFLDAFPEHVPCSLEEHDQLVRALANHDGRTAREVAEQHVLGAAELLSARVHEPAQHSSST